MLLLISYLALKLEYNNVKELFERLMSDQRKPQKFLKRPNIHSATSAVTTLAGVLLGFNVTIMGIAWITDFPKEGWNICIKFNTLSLGSGILGISSLFFLFATISGILSQLSDFYTMPEMAQKYVRSELKKNEQDQAKYIDECMSNMTKWYNCTVRLFDIGLIILLLGVGVLFKPANVFITILFVVAAAVIFIWSIVNEIKIS
jgi:hypothetical protein